MSNSDLCKVCGGKLGFTSSEFRRHESTKRHTDAVKDQEREGVPTAGELIADAALAAMSPDEVQVLTDAPARPALVVTGHTHIDGETHGGSLSDCSVGEDAPVPGSIEDLKAIRMRAKWSAQRVERRAQKAQELGQYAGDLLKAAEQAWADERTAYAAYRAALEASKVKVPA